MEGVELDAPASIRSRRHRLPIASLRAAPQTATRADQLAPDDIAIE